MLSKRNFGMMMTIILVILILFLSSVIILMQSSTERKYIIRYGSRTIVDRHIKAVYEIDKFLFREAPEE